jgi:hypothetical protein
MTDSINTLQEFMFRTKGIIYILAISFLIGFTWFWGFLNKNRKS